MARPLRGSVFSDARCVKPRLAPASLDSTIVNFPNFSDPSLKTVAAKQHAESALVEAARQMTERLFLASASTERVEDCGEEFPYVVIKVVLDESEDPVSVAKRHSEWHDRLLEIRHDAVLSIRLNVTYK